MGKASPTGLLRSSRAGPQENGWNSGLTSVVCVDDFVLQGTLQGSFSEEQKKGRKRRWITGRDGRTAFEPK